MNDNKIQQLRTYFEKEKKGITVCTERDFDTRDWKFRFDKDDRIAHMLRISYVMIQDNPVQGIIQKLEEQSWKQVLEHAGTKQVVFTSQGFKLSASA